VQIRNDEHSSQQMLSLEGNIRVMEHDEESDYGFICEHGRSVQAQCENVRRF